MQPITETGLLERLEDCLLEWETRREKGESVSPSELCPDWPAGQIELALQIKRLQACDRFLRPEGTPLLSQDGRSPVLTHFAGYEVRGVLGRGGMGVVFRVWDPLLQREAALKMIEPGRFGSYADELQRLGQRFQREAQVLAKLKHEGIVPIFEAKLHEGHPYFVMECIPGGSLNKHRAELTAAGARSIVPFVEKIARAVDFAHKNGILHRDLKPANILLETSGKPLISDFGLAKLLGDAVNHDLDATERPQSAFDEAASSSRLTTTGIQPGTPAYMAPEQFDPKFGLVGPAADIWAMGVILYELLLGQKPFPGKTREELRQAICHDAPDGLRTLQRNHGRRLQQIVARCLEKDPSKRFASAGALADALGRWRRQRLVFKWAVAAAAILALAAALTSIATIEFQPERRYQRAIQQSLKSLERGEGAELIPANDGAMPAFRIRCGEKHSQVKRSDDGVTISSPALGVVEFMTLDSKKSYRVVAELRHDQGWGMRTTMGGTGVTFTGLHAPSPAGSHHIVGFLGFDDWQTTMFPSPNHKGALMNRAMLQLLWYLDEPTDSKYPFRMRFRAPANSTGYFPQAAEAVKPWRTIIFDIRPEATTALWGDDKQPPIGPLTPSTYQNFTKTLVEEQREVAGIELSNATRRAIGILVSGGQCTLRRLVVTPLPDVRE